MDERLTWKEIQDKYPDQWVGLTDVEYVNNDGISIETAIVKIANMKKNDCTRMTANGEIIGRYTTPDNVFQLGMIGVI